MQQIIESFYSYNGVFILFIVPYIVIICLIAVCFMQARDNNKLKERNRQLEAEHTKAKLTSHTYLLTPERRDELIKHMQELEERAKQRGIKPGQLTYKE